MKNKQTNKKATRKTPKFVTNKCKYNRFWKVGQHHKAGYSLANYRVNQQFVKNTLITENTRERIKRKLKGL